MSPWGKQPKISQPCTAAKCSPLWLWLLSSSHAVPGRSTVLHGRAAAHGRERGAKLQLEQLRVPLVAQIAQESPRSVRRFQAFCRPYQIQKKAGMQFRLRLHRRVSTPSSCGCCQHTCALFAGQVLCPGAEQCFLCFKGLGKSCRRLLGLVSTGCGAAWPFLGHSRSTSLPHHPRSRSSHTPFRAALIFLVHIEPEALEEPWSKTGWYFLTIGGPQYPQSDNAFPFRSPFFVVPVSCQGSKIANLFKEVHCRLDLGKGRCHRLRKQRGRTHGLSVSCKLTSARSLRKSERGGDWHMARDRRSGLHSNNHVYGLLAQIALHDPVTTP